MTTKTSEAAMTTAGHTPGPWRLTGEGYVSSAHGYVQIRTPFREGAFDKGDPSQEFHARAAANARLIAAAPELLAALETVASLPGFEPSETYAAVVLAAIAKATGR